MRIYQKFLKRIIDVCASGTVLMLLSPIYVLTALLIRLEDRGPALFRQQRVGENGRFFTLLKFRSMPVTTENLPSVQAGSLRTTRIGYIIRRTNIDELPQLFNILLGDMSLTGPRPALPSQTMLLDLRRQNGAWAIRPGLTGLAQVNSYDGMPESEKAGWDGKYASNVTFWGDTRIVLLTFRYLMKRPPVY